MKPRKKKISTPQVYVTNRSDRLWVVVDPVDNEPIFDNGQLLAFSSRALARAHKEPHEVVRQRSSLNRIKASE